MSQVHDYDSFHAAAILPETFEYESLHDVAEIRVLKFHPGEDKSLIVCSLCTVSLSEKPEYCALSYTWGGNQKPKAISCNGHSLPVTENLYKALYILQDFGVPLWIDAICVNQSDLDEQSRQVRTMQRIFASADEVLIWLGEEFRNPDTIFEFISFFKNEETVEDNEKAANDLRLSRFNSESFAALAEFVQCPWFYRVWVIQELAMAKTARMVFGKHTVDWELMERMLKYVNKYNMSHIFGAEPQKLNPLNTLNTIRRSISSTGIPTLSILELLNQTQPFSATLPVDRIFALYGIACDSAKYVTVDYSLKCEQVYTDLIVKLLVDEHDLSCLSLCGLREQTPSLPALPSWVPDWPISSANPLNPLSGAGFSAGTSFAPSISIKEGVLTLRGYQVDVLSRVGELSLSDTENGGFWKSDTERDELLRRDVQAAMEFLEFTAGLDPYVTGARLQDVEWRVAVCNRLLSGEVPPESYEAIFAQSIAHFRKLVDSPDISAPIILDTAADAQHFYHFMMAVGTWCTGRRFARSADGYLGQVPAGSRAGDVVVVCAGAQAPYVMREGQGKDRWRLLGECYMHGLMEGEGEGGAIWREFDIE